MEDLKYIDTELLVEMLAIYTAEYTNMLSKNIKGEAFDNCEFNISRLQAAINARQKNNNVAKITQAGNYFNQLVNKIKKTGR